MGAWRWRSRECLLPRRHLLKLPHLDYNDNVSFQGGKSCCKGVRWRENYHASVKRLPWTIKKTMKGGLLLCAWKMEESESVASVNVAWAQLANLNMAAGAGTCAHAGTLVEIMGYVQGTRKKYVIFAKQDPGRARQNS